MKSQGSLAQIRSDQVGFVQFSSGQVGPDRTVCSNEVKRGRTSLSCSTISIRNVFWRLLMDGDEMVDILRKLKHGHKKIWAVVGEN